MINSVITVSFIDSADTSSSYNYSLNIIPMVGDVINFQHFKNVDFGVITKYNTSLFVVDRRVIPVYDDGDILPVSLYLYISPFKGTL